MNTELIAYYANLLIIQYRDKPKAVATIEALISLLMIYDLAIAVRDGYDIETAIGDQQDVLAKYTGTTRTVTGVDFTRTYFGYITYDDTPPVTGIDTYATYTGGTPDVQFRQYGEEGGTILSLNDEELRLAQKLKIGVNYSAPSLKNIDDLMYSLFGTDAYCTDNEDMTIEYTFPSDQLRLVTIANAEGYIPKPAGVGLSINFV